MHSGSRDESSAGKVNVGIWDFEGVVESDGYVFGGKNWNVYGDSCVNYFVWVWTGPAKLSAGIDVRWLDRMRKNKARQ